MANNESDKASDQAGNKAQHRNDIYGDIKNAQSAEASPAIPAATVVLLRDTEDNVEVLMLHKNSKIAFGGMWVFPGGKIDEEDHDDSRDPDVAARNAAVRETEEEAGLKLRSDEFVWFAHWTPPATTPKRYATWFFASQVHDDEPIQIDGGEIQDHAWMNPDAALARHAAGEIDLAPPTWLTLYDLAVSKTAAAALGRFSGRSPKVYETRVVQDSEGVRVAMWAGDAGYEHWDADRAGERHRLVMTPGGFRFENDVEQY